MTTESTIKLQDNEYFFLNDGTSLKSLADLKSALGKMPDDVFQHHVNADRNDFSNWVRGVFKDDKLASILSAASSAKEMAAAFRKKQNKSGLKKSKKKPRLRRGEIVLPAPHELKPKRIVNVNYPERVVIGKITEAFRNG